MKTAATPKWVHRSFFDEIDAICPAFEHAEIAVPTNLNGYSAQGAVMHGALPDPRRYVNGGALHYDIETGEPSRHEFAMPWVGYVRGMDPAGNILPLNTVTCQTAAECEGFDSVMLGRKVKAGWLICERHTPHSNGKEGEEWGEYLRAEFLRRRNDHYQKEQKSAEGLETRAEQHLRSMAKEQREANAELLRSIVASQGGGPNAELLEQLAEMKKELAALKKAQAKGG